MSGASITHAWLLPILHLGWLVLPIPLYYLLLKRYLDTTEMYLLVVAIISLTSLMFGGMIMQITRALVYTLYALLILELCVQEF